MKESPKYRKRKRPRKRRKKQLVKYLDEEEEQKL